MGHELGYIIWILNGIMVILILWFLRKRRQRVEKGGVNVKSRVRSPAPESRPKARTLDANEEKIIRGLIEHRGLSQQELCEQTGIQKSTMSNILARLEQSGIVKRIEKGREKIVKLRGWVKKILLTDGGYEHNLDDSRLRMIELVLVLKENEDAGEEHITQTEISKQLKVSSSTVARYLDELKEKNIVGVEEYQWAKWVKLNNWVRNESAY